MGQNTIHPILKKPIRGMNVSREFKAMAKANHYRFLEDILEGPLHHLPFKPQSGYRILRELLEILRESGLEHFVEEDFG